MLSLQKRACDTCTHKSSTLRSIKLAAVTPLPLWPAAAPTQRSQRRCSTANALWDSLKLPWARPAEPNPQQVASQALLTALEGSDRGITTSSTARAEIEAAVQALEQLQGSEPTTGVELSATWELLWTTERETLWILKNAGLFGTTAGGVYQVRLQADNMLACSFQLKLRQMVKDGDDHTHSLVVSPAWLWF